MPGFSIPALVDQVKLIVSSRPWRIQQSLVVIAEIFLGFSTVMALAAGVSQGAILVGFACLYAIAAETVHLQRTRPDAPFLSASIWIAAGASLLTAFAIPSSAVIFSLMAGAGFVVAARDSLGTSVLSQFQQAAIERRLAPTSVIAMSFGLGVVITATVLAGSGILADRSPGILYAAIGLLLVPLALAEKTARRRSAGDLGSDGRIPIPRPVVLHCLLSGIYNPASFIARRYLVPAATMEIAASFELDSSVMSIMGVLLGIMTLMAFIGRSARGLDGKDGISAFHMMTGGYFAGLILWGIILLAMHLMKTMDPASAIWLTALLIAALAFMEIASKIWTIGFVEGLRLQSKFHGGKNSEQHNKAYLGVFMTVKSIGVSAGFLVAAALAPFMNVLLLAALLIAMALGYLILFFFLCPREVYRPAE